MKRHAFVLASSLVLAACAQPVRRDARNDTRGGADKASRSDTDVNWWRLDGTLDTDDHVDWIFVDMVADRLFHVDVSVTTDDARDGFDSEVYAVDGRLIARSTPNPDPKSSAEIRSMSLQLGGPFYVRVATNRASPTSSYTVVVLRGPEVMMQKVEPRCDRDHFDPTNPACAGQCDFKNPDPKNPDCCELWLRCQDFRRGRRCSSNSLTWDGDLVMVPLGIEHGVFGRPEAIALPLRSRVAKPAALRVEKVEARRSIWSVRDPDVLEWLRAHATRVEIQIPWTCPV